MHLQPPDIRIHCGGAMDVLNAIESGSLDAAVFDPPYSTISGGSNAKKGGKHQRPSGILTKNDGKIFKHNDIKPSEYLPAIHRVLRDDAHIYIMTNVLNLIEKDILGDLRRAGFQVHNILFWRKNNATPNRWYMKDTEITIFARKGRAFTINNPGARSTQSALPHPKDSPEMWDDLGWEEFPFELDWDNVSSPKSHPTEKPVNLMLTYIENSTKPGETVLDPFMGTGSTGVACLESGRGFLGIEIDPTYAAYAATRLHVPVRQAATVFDIDDLLCPNLDIDDLLGPAPSAESLLS